MGDLLADQVAVEIPKNVILLRDILLHPPGTHAAADIALPGIPHRLHLGGGDILGFRLIVEIALGLIRRLDRAIERLVRYTLCRRLLGAKHDHGRCQDHRMEGPGRRATGENRKQMKVKVWAHVSTRMCNVTLPHKAG